MQKQSVLVLSGYNFRAVIAFCRWAKLNRISFHVVANNEKDPIFLTEYKENVFVTRESNELRVNELCMWVELLCDKFNLEKLMILPVSEYFNRFLLENRGEIENEKCIVPLVEKNLYESISDKYQFSSLCLSFGLQIPKEYSQVPAEFPFVAKPRNYLSSKGEQLKPWLIHNADELIDFKKQEDIKDYFFQEFVYGKSIYLLAYIGDNNSVIFSQENLIQQPKGGSIVLARKANFHDSDMARKYISMLLDIKFRGLIMIELRVDETNGKYVMIEANPRLWGPMQFCLDNNIDLFGALLKDYNFEISCSVGGKLKEFYFWSNGLSENLDVMAYFDYSKEKFLKDKASILEQDIFYRDDTLKLYLEK